MRPCEHQEALRIVPGGVANDPPCPPSLSALSALRGGNIMDPMERDDILKVSRGTSIILLVIYGGYLFFTLSSHKVSGRSAAAPR